MIMSLQTCKQSNALFSICKLYVNSKLISCFSYFETIYWCDIERDIALN